MAVSRCATFLLFVAVLVLPSEGSAQRPSAAQQAEARALFHQGASSFEAGDFQRALDLFERSYELSRRPVLLFNIGSAADRLRNDERAIRAFRAYLEALPDADNASSVRSRLAHLEQASGPERIERVEVSESEPIERIERIERVAPEDVANAQQSDRRDLDVSEARELATSQRARRTGPLALLVAGGALVVAGGALFTTGYLGARSVEDEMQPEWSDVEDRVHRSSLFLNLGYALSGVGAALVIGGAIWWSVADAPVELALSPTGLMVRGSFQ